MRCAPLFSLRRFIVASSYYCVYCTVFTVLVSVPFFYYCALFTIKCFVYNYVFCLQLCVLFTIKCFVYYCVLFTDVFCLLLFCLLMCFV